MPEPMPDWLADWLHTVTLFDLAMWVIGLLVAIWIAKRGWKRAVTFATAILELAGMVSAVHGLPEFMVDQSEFRIATTNTLAGQNETLEAQNVKIEGIHHETHHNNGSSIKDAQKRTEEAVERIELGVKGLYTRADQSDLATDALREDLEDTKTAAEMRAIRKETKEQS